MFLVSIGIPKERPRFLRLFGDQPFKSWILNGFESRLGLEMELKKTSVLFYKKIKPFQKSNSKTKTRAWTNTPTNTTGKKDRLNLWIEEGRFGQAESVTKILFLVKDWGLKKCERSIKKRSFRGNAHTPFLSNFVAVTCLPRKKSVSRRNGV